MSDAQVVVNVSKDIIDAHVKAAVVTALGRDPEALVRAVVDAAMNQKSERSYGRTSIWDEKVNAMILEVAQQSFQEWLNEQRPIIAAAVRKRLSEKGGRTSKLIESVVEKLTGALGTFRVRLDISE